MATYGYGYGVFNFPVDRILEAYYEKDVIVHDKLTERNRRIAEYFMSNFTKFVQKNNSMNVGYFEQGSAFEGLKVGLPDEFDFLLTILNEPRFADFTPDRQILYDYSAMKSRNPAAMAPYTPITLVSKTLLQPSYLETLATWPRTQACVCFSAQACVRFFQTCINKYVALCQNKQHEDGINYRIKGVIEVKPPSIGNPALTTRLMMDDGTEISIDITLAAVLGTKYYIAKRKPNEPLSDDERYNMLWHESHSEQEKAEINLYRTHSQKKNYRISKGLLRKELPNSFILKTIFLRENNRASKEIKAYDFLKYMLRELEEGYGAEIRRRGLAVSVRHAGELLLARYNKDYNLLAKYEDTYIANSYRRIVSLNDGIMKDPEALLSKLLTEMKLTH